MSDGRKMMGGGRNGFWSRRQYLSAVSGLAECMCAPFWWSVAKPEDTAARILHNGTICYVDTGHGLALSKLSPRPASHRNHSESRL